MNNLSLVATLLEKKDFVDHYEAGRFWSGTVDKELLQRVFSWNHLNHALSTSRITNDRFRLSAKGLDLKPNQQAFRPTRDAFGRLTDSLSIAELHKLMRQGATGILEAVNELFPAVEAFTERLSAQYSARSTANAYISFGVTSGFGAHNDDHDVIVIQVEGRKKWQFFNAPNIVDKATVNNLTQLDETNAGDVIVLSPGDVLFVPKGTWHDVMAIDEASLHLTVSLVYPTVSDYVKWLLEQYPYDVPYQDIKINQRQLKTIATDNVSFFSRHINESSMDCFLQSYYARYMATRVRPSFPSLNRVTPNEKFRKVPFHIIDMEKTQETEKQTVFSLGKKHHLNKQAYQVLKRLSYERALSGTELLNLLGEGVTWDQLALTLESLLDKSLISKSNMLSLDTLI